jgi:hypothetical protein
MMQLIGQRDVKWAGKTIGDSKSLIKDYGCTISGISMLSDWYGCFHDPGWMAKNLRFLRDLIIWASVEDKLCFKWVWRQYGYNEKRILDSLGGKTTSCLFQVYRRHWVVGIRKIGSYYWIADPWYPKRRMIHKSAISGSSHFDRK